MKANLETTKRYVGSYNSVPRRNCMLLCWELFYVLTGTQIMNIHKTVDKAEKTDGIHLADFLQAYTHTVCKVPD
jgi:hypothetical protein